MVYPNHLISHETAWAKIVTLPSLSPYPTATKIHALYTHLCKVLAKIPSFQSQNHGYQGVVDAAEIYVLTRELAWINFPNPGFHCQADGTLNQSAQRNVVAIVSVSIIVYTSKQNAKGAVNDALNEAVPKVYHHNPTVIGVRELRPNDDPRKIIATLTRRCRQKTTAGVNNQDNR